MAVEYTFIALEKEFKLNPAFVYAVLAALREVSEELRAEEATMLTTALVTEQGSVGDGQVMEKQIKVAPQFAPTLAKIGPEQLVKSIDAVIEALEKGRTNPNNFTTAATKLMKLKSNNKFYQHEAIQKVFA